MSETVGGERTAKDRISFLRTLRAVRSFRPDPVPREVVDDVLEVARWSGSAANQQPWEILVVRDRDTLRSLASVEGYAGHLAGAPLGIVLIMAGERAERETYDEGRLAERIMLAAHAHGVGSSIGWIVGPGRDAARELLRIPREKGGADRDFPRLPRRGGPEISRRPRAGAQTPRRDRLPRTLRLGEP
jgi:nitroreductase